MASSDKYFRVENYAMKCRLYPNLEQEQRIDEAIHGVQTFYNCTLHEMFRNGNLVTEKQKKGKDGTETEETVHFPDFTAAGSVAWKTQMLAEHPIVGCAPASAITCKSGLIADMRKSLGKLPVEYQKPRFYSKRYPRRGYSYQESFSKVKIGESRNAFRMDLCRIGPCKVRGWDKKLRFDEDGKMDFFEYAKSKTSKDKVTITVSKDNCGDYWIVFKLPFAYKLMAEPTGKAVGVDVGIKDIAITSEGEKFQNKKFKQSAKKRKRALNRRMSRRQGWANEKFREERKSDDALEPSKSYEQTKLSMAKMERRIAWQRDYWNHHITRSIVESASFIGVESLNVKGMFRNRHLANALSDAAMGDILQKLGYKAGWYGRQIQAIGQWEPSSKRCNDCGYVMPAMPLSVREWDCPMCGAHHDRDINAARNIRDIALAMAEEGGT